MGPPRGSLLEGGSRLRKWGASGGGARLKWKLLCAQSLRVICLVWGLEGWGRGGGVAPLDGAHGRGEMECYRLTAQRGAARCVGGGLEE